MLSYLCHTSQPNRACTGHAHQSIAAMQMLLWACTAPKGQTQDTPILRPPPPFHQHAYRSLIIIPGEFPSWAEAISHGIIRNCMLVIDMNSRLNCRSGGVGREPPSTTAWQQFPALLATPVVEPRVLSRNTEKSRFQIRPIMAIYKSLPETWM